MGAFWFFQEPTGLIEGGVRNDERFAEKGDRQRHQIEGQILFLNAIEEVGEVHVPEE